MRLRLATITLLAIVACAPAFAAGKHVKWSAKLEPADARAGESAQIVLTAELDKDWHVYSQTTPPGGAKRTEIELELGDALTPEGSAVQPAPSRKKDPNFPVDVEAYEGAVSFGIPVKLNDGISGAQTASVKVTYQVCDPRVCVNGNAAVPVAFTVAAGDARPDHKTALTSVPAQPAAYVKPAESAPSASGSPVRAGTTEQQIQDAKKRGLLSFIWLSLIAGFAALFTPCVFPMIPITVSFFSKKEGKGIAGPVAYCGGIISTFTGLGLIMTLLFGASSINNFATNPYVNIGLAVLFITLAANLFGVFEIVLPSALVNKAHQGTGKGGLIGPLLMGFTFTLTSFTCTVPFVGTILVTATKGDFLYPLLGMLAFSAAFALPFFFLAMFPQYLASLPKSGGWLVSVKAYMGFLELAAALKFLSNADLVWRLGLLTRPIFLAVWFGIFAIAGFYLLGWLKLPHDAGGKIGIPRRVLGLATVAGGFYMLAAIEGAPLKQLEAMPPPDPYPGRVAKHEAIPWIRKYELALVEAKALKKPVFINFTGVT